MNTTHLPQTRTATYHWMSDPGHAWLAVDMEELDLLGITKQISPYSYQRNDIAYLEEDCDAGLFLEAMRAKGVAIQFRTHHTDHDSVIRSYRRFP